MRRNLMTIVLAAALLCFLTGAANAVPLSEDMSGYYKVGYLDDKTYAAKVEMGIGALKVHVLPDMNTLYLGIILDDKVYFVDGFNRPRWGVLTKLDEDTALITSHDADTGETREFTVVRITEEEANRITEENRQKDLNAGCVHNLQRIGVALIMFAKDHDGELPYSFDELYPDYIGDKNTFVCPVRDGQFRDFETDYEYIPGFRIDSPNPSEEAVVIESPGNHSSPVDSYYVLYLDGHVEMKAR